MELLINIGILLFLIALGYIAGRRAEKKHYKSIEEREQKFLQLPAVTLQNCLDPQKNIVESTLVEGSVVISIDYFKRIYANLINFFGGEMAAYETLIDRARREAILRMKEQSPQADIICNMRLETATIAKTSGNNRQSVGSVEAIAYGTAITYQK